MWIIVSYFLVGLLLAEACAIRSRLGGPKVTSLVYFAIVIFWPLIVISAVIKLVKES